MLSKGSCLKIILVCSLAVAVQIGFRLAVKLGVFSHHHPHYPGSCKKLPGIQPGAEDFHTLPSGLTFISSGFHLQTVGDEVLEYFRSHNIIGRVYLFDFKKSEAGVRELKIRSSEHFKHDRFVPHGISVWEDTKSGRHTVFIVSHCLEEPMKDRIEKFVYSPEKQDLEHVASYSDESMNVVNDVQATGENSFYFTNSQYYKAQPLAFMEMMLGILQFTDVVYFDGSAYKTVAGGMQVPNGLAMSNDQQYVYVAASLSQELHVYKRNKDNSLTQQQVFPLGTAPDNPLVDPKTGNVYLGNHPLLYKALLHLEDPKLKAPSQVLLLRVKDGNITSTQELLYDDGDLISGSSSAVVYDGKLLVGSVHNNLVLCDVSVPM